MEYNSFLQKCNDDDVLELDNQMIKLSKFRADSSLAFTYHQNRDALVAIAKYIKQTASLSNTNVQQLFNGEGINANILRIGSQGWKKGKIKFKITLEFCPEEPEIEEITPSNITEINQISSPLDDILQMMNREN